ncbi:MAG: 2-phosphosulfolactate phosphatase [Planctomycetota bacterium]|nr:2-phosphosulfolactate phosphatase [Planctomycetota bacterium]
MQPTVSVHLLPSLVDPAELADRTVVVIDVLRATTTITTALAAGAAGIIPCLEVEAAREQAQQHPAPVLLGGERQGKKIEGFDLGNSPAEYTSTAVRSRTILFTTTNGTRALDRCQQAARVLIAGFVNLSAVARHLKVETPIHLLCAGTDGKVSLEDSLLAGALVDRLIQQAKEPLPINDQACIAQAAWHQASQGAANTPWLSLLEQGLGGQNLARAGLAQDIPICAAMDTCTVVPELNLKTGIITLA